MKRISATDAATTQNRQHKKMIAALDALGMAHRPIVRNVDHIVRGPARVRLLPVRLPEGVQAVDDEDVPPGRVGRWRPVRRRLSRRSVLVEDGRAAGVAATVTHADGSTTALTVNAPTVVVACGSVESPALLLRSGIGGPAVGKHLRLHPAGIVNGIYDEPIEAWIGQIQSEVSDHFADCDGEWGFLIESVGATPSIHAAGIPWHDGEQHKREFARMFRHHAPFLSVARDHGEGEIVLDGHGRPVIRWSLSRRARPAAVHPRQRRARAACTTRSARPRSGRCTPTEMSWRRDSGEAFEEFVRRIEDAPLRPRRHRRSSPPTRWARAGWDRTRRTRSPTAAASCTTSRACGSVTRARSRPRRASTRWSRSWRSPTGRRDRSSTG